MIHYDLQCDCGHRFDGWFAGNASFERQAGDGLLSCSNCGANTVTRALMAPSIGKNAKNLTEEAGPRTNVRPANEGALPDRMRALLARVRRDVETRCDYVGGEFASEARRIHNGEASSRGIYGEATEAESEALADEGIAFARIPWVPRTDS